MGSDVNWKSYVGKRVLIKERGFLRLRPTEVKVLEVSPSGDMVKLQYVGGALWEYAGEYTVIEVLGGQPHD